MTAADARDILINERGGPDGFGFPAYATDVTTIMTELLDDHFTYSNHADVKASFRGPAQYDSSSKRHPGRQHLLVRSDP